VKRNCRSLIWRYWEKQCKLGQDSQYPGQDSNWSPPENKSEECTDVPTLLCDMVMGCLSEGNHHHIKLYDFWKCSPTANKLRATLTQIFERSESIWWVLRPYVCPNVLILHIMNTFQSIFKLSIHT